MQLSDLKKPLEDMSDEELRQMLTETRRRRETIKQKVEKKPVVRTTALEKLTKEQILARLQEMGVM